MSGYMALGTMNQNGTDAGGGGGGGGNDGWPPNNNNVSNNYNNNSTTADQVVAVRAVQQPHHNQGGVTPLEELLLGVETNNEAHLLRAIKNLNTSELNHYYSMPQYAAALHIATKNNFHNLVYLLLKAGADPDVRNEHGKQYCALHYAAQGGKSEIITTLLKFDADPNAKEEEFGRTSLHIVAKEWGKISEDNSRLILDLLLSNRRIKPDTLDSNKASPLFMSSQKGIEYMTRQLILKGANVKITIRGKSAADFIRGKLPQLSDLIDSSEVKKLERNYSDELYQALQAKNMDTFQEIIQDIDNNDNNNNKVSILNEFHGDYTLLQYACDRGYEEFVHELLKEGADQAKKVGMYSPILYAARKGFSRIMENLIENLKTRKQLEKGALKQSDQKGETPLHKVVKREFSLKEEGVDYYQCLQLLMKEKKYVNIDALDSFHFTPLHYAVLCDEQSFVRCLLMNGANLGIKNKFGTRAITRIKPALLEEVLNYCIEHKNDVNDGNFEIILNFKILAPATDKENAETELLKFLSRSIPHRHLLLHPIIDTFLSLKWQKIRPYLYFNLLAYLLFLIPLSTYILIYHSPSISKSNNITNADMTDIDLNNVRKIVAENMVVKIILQIIILIFTLYIAVREIVQFCVSWKLYIQRIENGIEVLIVLMTVLLIIIPLPPDFQQSICAWLILLSWIELVLLVGRHPRFAVYITMFTTVSFNFLKFILMFSLLIFAFSISFYLVLQTNENFETYAKSLLKTLAMSTGELEYADLPLDKYPFSSHLLFLCFVFLIVLVLMNLLNGLAVSDIQQIRHDSEIVSYRSRIELISYIESVFLASPLKRVCCNPEACLIAACLTTSNPVIKLLNWMGKRTLMFKKCLQDPCISLYPNKGTDRWFVCSCHSFQLEESQIEAAKSVVLAETSAVVDRLTILETRINESIEAISHMSKIIQTQNRHSIGSK